jgi:PAB-dependent poly(A)-specific ribonuclease subunit 2
LRGKLTLAFTLCQSLPDTISNRDPSLIQHEYLDEDEMPKPGTMVAIDAEFVLMQQVRSSTDELVSNLYNPSQEETDFRSDGSKKVLRPARLSLARVSVLRGGEHKQGVPFIDDHIHTSEPVANYLTEFSGIRCAFSSC